MLRQVLFITILLIPFKAVYAGAIDFRVGGDAAELSFLTQASSFGYGGADIGFGVMINEYDDVMANASIIVSGSGAGDVRGLHFGVGAKAYLGALDGPQETVNANGGAVAIGARIRYVFPSDMPLAVLAEGYFAPEVTSIADIDGLFEYRLALELEVTPSARAYIGYRKLEVEFDDFGRNVDYEVDDSAHVGVRFEF